MTTRGGPLFELQITSNDGLLEEFVERVGREPALELVGRIADEMTAALVGVRELIAQAGNDKGKSRIARRVVWAVTDGDVIAVSDEGEGGCNL